MESNIEVFMIYRAKVRQLFQINKKLKKKSDQRNRPLITRSTLRDLYALQLYLLFTSSKKFILSFLINIPNKVHMGTGTMCILIIAELLQFRFSHTHQPLAVIGLFA